MRHPDFNPRSDACCTGGHGCEGFSRVYFLGNKGIFSDDGMLIGSISRWECEFGHVWSVKEEI